MVAKDSGLSIELVVASSLLPQVDTAEWIDFRECVYD